MRILARSPLPSRGSPQGGKIKRGPHVGGLVTSPLPSEGSPTNGQNQKGTTCEGISYFMPAIWGVPHKGANQKWRTSGRFGYITPAVWGVPHKGTKIIKGPHVGGLATSPLPSRGSPTRGRNQKGTTCERIGYITRAIWGVPHKGKKSEGGHMCAYWPDHPCRLGAPHKGAKSKEAYTWADWLHHPCRLQGHQQMGKIRRGPHVRG